MSCTRSGRKIKSISYRERKSDNDSSPEKRRKPSRGRVNQKLVYDENSDSDIFSSPTKRKLSYSSGDDFVKTPTKTKSTPRSVLTPKTRRNLNEITDKLIPKLNIETPKKLKPKFNLGCHTPSKSILKTPNTRTPAGSKRVSILIDTTVKVPISNKENTELDAARQKLHVSAVPESLPCRENEYSDIYNFIYGMLSSDSSGCMYVAGVPGTGKTATVTEVIKNLQDLSMDDDVQIPTFDYVHINGMRLTEPRQTYVQIYKQLTGKTLVWDQAYECLKKKIVTNSNRKRPIVLLVDELDIIHTKRQDVVYNILDWPSKLNSKIIIIAISNTMDLPERLLMGRVASRLGLTRLPFQPYTFKQLEVIVKSRLEGLNVFQSEAIQLVSRKVAAVSGDARRALDICRRAAEIASQTAKTENQQHTVTIKHVNEALTEMINSDQIKSIQNLTKIEQFLLQAIIVEVQRTGVDETCYRNVLKQFQTLCRFNGVPEPSTQILTIIMQHLTKQKMVVVSKSKWNVIEQLYLNISQDDVLFALNHN